MPELPEVETTCRGIAPYIEKYKIINTIIRCHSLRWKIKENLPEKLKNNRITSVSRRSKYILIHFLDSTLMIHLGMSGNLRIVSTKTPLKKHDHVDIILNNKHCLRYNDTRRFGSLQLINHPLETHPLLAKLGLEPLTTEFNGHYLYKQSRKKKQVIKNFIMNHHIVVGIGNIYANEVLFKTNIHPTCPAYKLTLSEYNNLSYAIKKTLKNAIEKGGTTLKDFVSSNGNPGYFQQKLLVYSRHQDNCFKCQSLIQRITINNRSSFYCPKCQPL